MLQQEVFGQLGGGQGLKLLTGVVIEHKALSWLLVPHCTFHRPWTGSLFFSSEGLSLFADDETVSDPQCAEQLSPACYIAVCLHIAGTQQHPITAWWSRSRFLGRLMFPYSSEKCTLSLAGHSRPLVVRTGTAVSEYSWLEVVNSKSSEQLPDLLALQRLHTAQQRGVDHIYILVQCRQRSYEKTTNERKAC
ncbi:hypothetical protein F7725_014748 [Dissostichus mawsoni]|uniref:Uncharacterized protein n=1 Tax=Dissostichus mawsoni TaxID=36200 RepID=A0A7J5YX63_DISMA|nr:hypothetical protein F7725_014748 [Dissostichus mawsoni]